MKFKGQDINTQPKPQENQVWKLPTNVLFRITNVYEKAIVIEYENGDSSVKNIDSFKKYIYVGTLD